MMADGDRREPPRDVLPVRQIVWSRVILALLMFVGLVGLIVLVLLPHVAGRRAVPAPAPTPAPIAPTATAVAPPPEASSMQTPAMPPAQAASTEQPRKHRAARHQGKAKRRRHSR